MNYLVTTTFYETVASKNVLRISYSIEATSPMNAIRLITERHLQEWPRSWGFLIEGIRKF